MLTLLENKSSNKSGFLIVFEGIDGAGKSSSVDALIKHLKENDYDVVHTKWSSSKLLKAPIKKAKNKRMLNPILYCLMHAADMVVRYNEEILPALDDGKIVVADRYIYTSEARDYLRGIKPDLLHKIYAGFKEPDILFHCSVPVGIAFERLKKEKGFSYYGTGSDLNLAPSREENYLKYERKLNNIYNEILPKVKSYKKINTNRSPEVVNNEIIKIVMQKLS